jgi:type II secretory pathway component PulF
MADKILYVGDKKPGFFQFLGISSTFASKIKGAAANITIATASGLSLKDQTLLAKRLSFLMSANVPLLEALHVLREQTYSRGHGNMLDRIITDVSQGQTLSRAFGKFPKVFGEFAVHIVKVGEQSGTLATNLNYLSEELKKRHTLKRKVVGAFIYPALISVATLGITAFLMLYLFPKIMPIFSSLRMELPLSTKIVMTLSTFLEEWGIEFLVGTSIALIVVLVLLKKSRALRHYFDHLLIRMPLIGPVVQYFNIANGSRTLGLLLKSGVSLTQALPITADTTKNLVYKQHYVYLSETVNRGERLSLHLSKHKVVFPDIFGHMVAVGEKSGTLSETLVYLSEMYEAEVDDFTKNLSTLIEPFLMVVMGLVVGFIAISIITPIYGITQNLNN